MPTYFTILTVCYNSEWWHTIQLAKNYQVSIHFLFQLWIGLALCFLITKFSGLIKKKLYSGFSFKLRFSVFELPYSESVSVSVSVKSIRWEGKPARLSGSPNSTAIFLNPYDLMLIAPNKQFF